jgi:predicted Zn finger-like uncharacterized protein
MNVTCPNCATIYRVDPAKVPEAGVRARCAVCNAVFSVRRESGAGRTDAEPKVAAAPPQAPPRPEPPKVEPARAEPARVEPAPVEPPKAQPVRPLPVPSEPARAAETVIPQPKEPLPAPGTSAAPLRPAAPQRPVNPFTKPATGPGASPGGATGPAVPAAPARPTAPSQGAPVPAAPAASRPAPAAAAPAAPKAAASVPGAAPSRPAAPAGARPANPFLSQDPALKARRLARALISDMVVYHPSKRQDGLRDGNLKELFEEEIKKSWEEYAEQVGREVAESTTYFREALNEILAGGRQVF